MWNKRTIAFIKWSAKLSQDYYPEILGKMVVVNAPFVFSGIFSVIKGWLDEKTRKKIYVVGSDYQRILTEHIDLD
jgi:hypothetical protein